MTQHAFDDATLGAREQHGPWGRAPQPGASYVLVVDDEDVVRDFLTRCLEAAGYAVKQAASAAAALDVMTAGPAAAVLCDVRMPGEDGLWLAERVRTRWPEIPVIMTTALDDVHTVRRSRDLGVADYINKPIKPQQLLDVLRRVMPLPDRPADAPAWSRESSAPPHHGDKAEAEYTMESPVRCPACGERITNLKAVRLVRVQVNFTSTLPRRGRVLACPHCLAVVPAELTNF